MYNGYFLQFSLVLSNRLNEDLFKQTERQMWKATAPLLLYDLMFSAMILILGKKYKQFFGG